MKTSIEWTDHSFNPIRTYRAEGGEVLGEGHHCEKISPGCKNCYASRLQPRFQMPTYDKRHGVELRHRLDEKVLEAVLRRRKPTKYFPCDMTDLFGDWITDEWRDNLFAVMALKPEHTFQVLTKRPDRALEYFTKELPLSSRQEYVLSQAEYTGGVVFDSRGSDRANYGGSARNADLSRRRVAPGWPLPNVWLGVSVESPAYLHRLDTLRKIPNALPWVSLEPLLEYVDIAPYLDFLKWVVIGGESGPGARPFDLDWARKVIGDCNRAGVAAFMKQLGSKSYEDEDDERGWTISGDKKGGDIENWPLELRVREFPQGLGREG